MISIKRAVLIGMLLIGLHGSAFAGPIDVYQERQGALAIIIEYTRFANFLAQLEVGRTGTAFIFDDSGELIAAPDKEADELHPARSQEALLPLELNFFDANWADVYRTAADVCYGDS